MSTINPYYQPLPTYTPWTQGQTPLTGLGQPQIAPQGIFSSALGLAAGPLGGLIGGALGNRSLGQTIGNIAGTAMHFLPFSAGPGQPVQYVPVAAQPTPQMAPQGVVGDFLSEMAPDVGQLFGGPLGGLAGGLAGEVLSWLPFSAGPGQPVQYVPVTTPTAQPTPAMAPQGIIGDLAGQFGGQLGQWAGGYFGQPGLGRQLGGIAGGLAQQYLPFSAGPPVAAYPQYGQMAPQGIFGDIVGTIAGPVGGAIGGIFGNRRTGQQVGGVAGNLIKQFLPFSAGPGQPVQYAEIAPQGILGDIAGQFGGQLGQWAGGMFGQPALGRQIGDHLGGLAQQYLPFSATPQPVAYPQYGQMAPQGIFGDIAGSIAGPVGGAIGGIFGNRRTGQQVGGIAGNLIKQFLPFSAGPGQPVQYAEISPQGVISDWLGTNPNLLSGGWNKRPFDSSAIGNGQFAPFSVLPQQASYPYATMH